jgi:D-lactate dehydrogenase
MITRFQGKIGVFEIADWEKKLLIDSPLGNFRPEFQPGELHEHVLKKNAPYEIISIFIYSRINAALLKRLPRLRMIATRSTGYDHIDLDACKKRGIVVCNVPFYGENTVAEHTFALILSLSRNIHRAYMRTIKTDFSLEGLQGFDLKGKTLGVIGAGHIGLHVIKMARGFDMKVLAHDARKNTFLAEVLGFEYTPLNTLLSSSDIVSIHAPYVPGTHHLINRKNIALMKKGALLINTARGGLVDTNALVWALDKGILGGAGLDVLEGEELIKEEHQLLSKDYSKEMLALLLKNHILLHRENVVITPHIAFDSKEALARIMAETTSNICEFIAGKVQNKVA